MSIRSELRNGLIYAGDSPLALTIRVEQTGPMQLTVRAGSYTTTGIHKELGGIITPHGDQDKMTADVLVSRGEAYWLADGKRLRIWDKEADGTPKRNKTYVLGTDHVLNFTSDPVVPKEYDINLGTDGNLVDVIVRSRLILSDGSGIFAPYPAGWKNVLELVIPPFRIPAAATDLSAIDIFVFSVLPGFPPGTGPDDWKLQVL